MKKYIVLLAMATCIPFSVFARDTGDGCGLGWEVTDQKTLFGTTTRGTTNAFVPPTFGMTSGTLGCDQHPFAKNEMEGANYAVTNFSVLKMEMAQGQGESLAAFAETLGCNGQGVDRLGQLSQENYSQIIPHSNTSAVEMFDAVKNMIQQDSKLAQSCSAV